MAIAFNAATDGGNNGGTTSSLTFSHTCSSGSNRLLVVGISGDTVVDDVTGVTYGGVAMTLLAKTTTGNRKSYFYYLLAPTTGANNVVVSASSSHFLFAVAADYTGVKQTGQPDATATQVSAGFASTLTTSVTTVADNSWPILVMDGFNSSQAPSAGTGATRRTYGAAFGVPGLFDSGGDVTPAGSYSMTTTYPAASNKMSHIIGSFAPDTGGTTYTLTAANGSYTLTGQAASLKFNRKLTAAAGSYGLTGNDATLTYTPNGGPTYTLTAGAGTYTLTGQAVAFGRTYVLSAGVGSYTLTGNAAALRYSNAAIWQPVDTASGTWTVTGAASDSWSPVN